MIANKPITRSQKLRSFVAPLSAAGYGRRYLNSDM
jgi:hypothetical protein